METLEFILVIIAALCYGFAQHIDIHVAVCSAGTSEEQGAATPGATNMARVYGMSAGVLTLGGDMCKTAAAMLLGYLTLGDRAWRRQAWPAWLGIAIRCCTASRAAKGVSAGAAIALCIDWRAGLLTIAVFAIAALCSKKVSFGSICAALSLPVWALVLSCRSAVRSGDSGNVPRRHTAQGEYKAPG